MFAVIFVVLEGVNPEVVLSNPESYPVSLVFILSLRFPLFPSFILFQVVSLRVYEDVWGTVPEISFIFKFVEGFSQWLVLKGFEMLLVLLIYPIRTSW